MPGEPLLAVEHIDLTLGNYHILQDVSLTLQQSEVMTLVGLNGSGKTTLLRVILGLQNADSGSVRLRPGSRIGYMPQKLIIDETLPLSVKRFMTLARRIKPPQLLTALRETGVEHVLESPIQNISGGELQRVLLARALLQRPDLLVLDEPVQSVDVAGQYELYDLIGSLRRRHGCAILMVSHDLHLVLPTTDQVVCMNHHICCSGPPELVSRHPSFLELFGREQARHVAIYRHEHNHHHDAHGDVIEESSSSSSSSSQLQSRHHG
jgi:zinc transport system ATP-binding protein